MYDIFKKDKLIIFASGVVAGLVGMKVAKCDKTRCVVVKTLAKGMMAKDTVMEECTNLREEAEDICAEAKALAAAKAQATEEAETEETE